MATATSADKMQGLVLVRTAFVWTYMKGSLFFGLKFGMYYFKFYCKGARLSLAGCFRFRSGEGGGGMTVIG